MEFTRAKVPQAELKTALSASSKLVPKDAMFLINRTWEKIFSRATFNKKVIADRGQCPRSRDLLKIPKIRTAMKNNEKLEELNVTICFKNSEKDEVS